VKYAVIHTNVGTFKVQMMCGMLDVSRAGYYAWRDRKESLHAVKDRELAAKARRYTTVAAGRMVLHASLQSSKCMESGVAASALRVSCGRPAWSA
jgi:hypothetical protein